jgi:hypothetical protein
MTSRFKMFVAIVAIAGGWIAVSRDSVRERVVGSVAELANRAVTTKPTGANWGDVAKKIGDFAAEERGLKDSVGRAETAQPPAGQ